MIHPSNGPRYNAPVHYIIKELSGIAYVILSVLLSFVSMGIFSSILTTDYFWFNYDTTCIPILQTLNDYLSVRGDGAIDLTTPSIGLSTQAIVLMNAAYPRLILFSELTTLESAIAGLQNLDVSEVVFLVTPYCWVDFGKQWEIAYTTKRQERCKMYDNDNAAVYFEAILRNIDLDEWRASVQGRFDMYISDPIASSSLAGQQWVEKLLNHTPGSIDDEILYWKTFNMTHFTLQYGNGIATGIEDELIAVNAMGLSNPLELKRIATSFRMVHRTSMIMYNLLYNDFYALGANQSLVRHTPNYFGDIDPSQIEACVQEFPLPEVSSVVHNEIGSLGIIDARWIIPPKSLRDVVQAFRENFNYMLVHNATLRQLFQNLATPTSIQLHPSQWNDTSLRYLGGNLMCSYNSMKSFVQESFGFDDVCSTQLPLRAHWTGFNGVFAYAMSSKQSESLFCSPALHGDNANTCQMRLQWTREVFSSIDFAHIEMDLALVSQLGYMQFVSNNSVTTIEMQYLLDKSFEFFGWMAMYDWAWNEREALLIQGDVNSFYLMSKWYEPVPHTPSSPPSAVSIYMLSLASVTTSVLAFVALVSILLWCTSSSLPSSWIFFNPVVSTVWLNRNFSLIRGLAATICLGTIPLQAVVVDGFTQLTSNARPLLMSGLLAGESLWFSYVLYDFLLPASEEFIRVTAPQAALLAWIVVVAVDQLKPGQIIVIFDRQCESFNMHYMIHCTSGSVQFSQLYRASAILLIHISSIIAAFLYGWYLNRPRNKRTETSGMHIPMSFTAFTNDTAILSRSSMLMCGYIMYTFRGNNYCFDAKLWRFVKLTKPIRIIPCHGMLTELEYCKVSYRRRLSCRSFEVLGGFIFLCVSLASNIAYIEVVQNSLTNDFGWAGFNTSTTHPVLNSIINQQLLVTRNESMLNLTSPSNGNYMPERSEMISVYPGAIKRQLYSSSPLQEVIEGLRSLDTCLLPLVFTQYCWLDFDRNYEMASTLSRQRRCRDSYSSNGAVYLESGLRNLQSWGDWYHCWGNSFAIGILDYLKSTSTGQQWLVNVQSNTNSIAAEISYWEKKSIDRFILQWQNFKTVGFQDSLVVTNVWGTSYELLLSQCQGKVHIGQQTSMRMYWSFASDLWAVGANATSINGKSLIRQSPLFAFSNTSHTKLLYENGTLDLPFTPGQLLISEHLGPYGNIDMYYVQCPPSLEQFYGVFHAALMNLTFSDTTAQDHYFSLPKKTYIGNMPTQFLANQTLNLVGGSVICGDDIRPFGLLFGMAPLFGFENICHWWLSEFITPKFNEFAFAMLGFHFNHKMRITDDFEDFCANDVYAESNCVEIYNSSYNFLTEHFAHSEELATLAIAAEKDSSALEIKILQFLILNDDTTKVDWFERNIVDTKNERSWVFFGWCYLCEWVMGRREVLSFQGDHDSISFLSSSLSPLTLPLDSDEIPRQLSYIFSRCALYVTVFIIGATGIAVVYVVVCSGDIEPWNLLEINRLIGQVWIGRSLLIVRSGTALWLLNTSQLELVTVGIGMQFTSPPLAWTSVLLASSELLWLVYLCNDILSCITQQYTSFYARKSSALAWFLVSILTLLKSRTYTASIHRTCSFINMDFALECTSAYIEIGSWTQVKLHILVVLLSVVFMAALEYIIQPQLRPINIPSLLLNSTSYYMLDFKNWTKNDHVYLDRASAFLAGLVSIRWNGVLYIFDVKSWCFIHYTPNSGYKEPWLAKAISLHNTD